MRAGRSLRSDAKARGAGDPGQFRNGRITHLVYRPPRDFIDLVPAPRPRGLGVPGQDLKDPRDKHAEFNHVVAQKFLRGFNSDLAGIRDEVRRELDVGFGGVHLRRVAKAEDTAQALLGYRSADRAGRCSDDRRRLAGKGILAVGAAGPVDRVLEPAGDRAVVFRRNEKTASTEARASLTGATPMRPKYGSGDSLAVEGHGD